MQVLTSDTLCVSVPLESRTEDREGRGAAKPMYPTDPTVLAAVH